MGGSIKEVEVAVKILLATEKAYKVDFGGKEPTWVPKSQILDTTEDANGRIETIFIPEWLAMDKGMI